MRTEPKDWLPEGKLEQTDWERENEDEIIDRFLEDCEDKIKECVTYCLRHKEEDSLLNREMKYYFKKSKETQYEEYLDTPDEPEYDRMAEEEQDEEEVRG